MELSMYQFSIFFSNNCQSKDFQNQHCTCCMGIGTLSVAVFLCIISRQGKLPLVTVIFQHLAFKVKHFIPKPISIDKKKLGTSHFSVAGKQKFPSQQISQCPRACELAFVKAQRDGERRKTAERRGDHYSASITHFPSELQLFMLPSVDSRLACRVIQFLISTAKPVSVLLWTVLRSFLPPVSAKTENKRGDSFVITIT